MSSADDLVSDAEKLLESEVSEEEEEEPLPAAKRQKTEKKTILGDKKIAEKKIMTGLEPSTGPTSSAKYDPETIEKQLQFFKKLQMLRIHLEPALKALASSEDPKKEFGSNPALVKRVKNFTKSIQKLQKRTRPQALVDLFEERQPEEPDADDIEGCAKHSALTTDFCLKTAEATQRATDVEGQRSTFSVLQRNSIEEQIQNALRDNTWVSKVHPVCQTTGKQLTHLYDDRDFHIQFLKNITQDPLHQLKRGSSTSGGDQKLQNASELAILESKKRAKQKKRLNYERKASKGRKIRFEAIPKLQNFMASEPRQVSELQDMLMRGLFR